MMIPTTMDSASRRPNRRGSSVAGLPRISVNSSPASMGRKVSSCSRRVKRMQRQSMRDAGPVVDSQRAKRAHSRLPGVVGQRMHMKLPLAVVFVVAVGSLTGLTSQPAAAQQRRLTERDLFDFVWIANPQVSPDGSKAAFTRVNCDEKRTGYETSIWIAGTKANQTPVRMTNGKHDAQPRWSPDGKFIVFVRGGEKDEAGKPKASQLAL